MVVLQEKLIEMSVQWVVFFLAVYPVDISVVLPSLDPISVVCCLAKNR